MHFEGVIVIPLTWSGVAVLACTRSTLRIRLGNSGDDAPGDANGTNVGAMGLKVEDKQVRSSAESAVTGVSVSPSLPEPPH